MDDEFCLLCGAILPMPPTAPVVVVCSLCHAHHTVNPIRNKMTYKTEKNYQQAFTGMDKQSVAENPVVDKICDKCGYDKMSYACRQTRSADEGQTVYYTCLNCKYNIVENA